MGYPVYAAGLFTLPVAIAEVRFSVLIFVEEKILLGRVVGPNLFDAFIRLTIILQFLKVFHDFQGSAGTDRVIDQLVFGSGQGASSRYEASSNVQNIFAGV